MIDSNGRSIDYLRISITDRCNLRCIYCMPEGGVPTLHHHEILRYEELLRLTEIMTRVGIRHVRLTGGEPMTRRGCLDFVSQLNDLPGIESISMTSNGILLSGQVEKAKAAGLSMLNLSIDTLNPETYARLTRGGDVSAVLSTLDSAVSAGLRVKVNAVPVQGFNEEDLVDLARLAEELPVCVRFIELMPIGCARDLKSVPQAEVEARLTAAFGPLTPDETQYGHGPAKYRRPAGFTGSIGFISAVSHEFCDHCNRIRLTADGQLKLCLNHTQGLDLRAMLRSGADDASLEAAIRDAIAHKPDRHAFNESISDREQRRMNEIGG